MAAQPVPEGRTAFFQADARDPALILERAAATLDFREPAGVILFGVPHLAPDEDEVAGIFAALSAAIAPGSHLAICHLASDIEPETVARFVDGMAENGFPRIALRARAPGARAPGVG